MVLREKTILIISPESWDHVFVSKHHYASHLAKRGNRVFFLNPPTRNGKWDISSTEIDGLSVIDYGGFVSGLRFFPDTIQSLMIRNKFRQIERIIGFEIDVVWSFDNSVFFNFEALPSRVLKISHIVDLNQDFQFEKATATADICFATTDAIRKRQKKWNPRSFKINHGVSVRDTKTGVTLPGRNKHKALYVGNLNMKYLDWQILYDAASQIQTVDFIFLGPGAEEMNLKNERVHFKKVIHELPNVYFEGKVKSDDIGDYLDASDVLLIAYQQAYHRDQANPHKMMEYLASGKPVVATYTSEYEEISNLLYMSKSNGDWPGLLQDLLSNLSTANDQEKKLARIRYAQDNSYDKQLDRIEQLITDHVK